MIPFDRTWPYDLLMKDLYVPSCPFCGADNVLLPMRPKELADVRSGKKRLLVFPCCNGRVTVVDADQDYLLTDTKLR
ncbi:hypothetical protein [Paenibacillus nasutitermitis]|uniref:Uncharacterized protein n=1 Tax=Paenibacillus nasutitermitis TaxID=1652958 RepID=A0A917DXF2_9BACL|nr:hypothetical protein [Paenibacillus nasutitermitis]GGD76773.1 hypothetical protein GCM10010911_38610 [Paenibacillus nasutitermitis]